MASAPRWDLNTNSSRFTVSAAAIPPRVTLGESCTLAQLDGLGGLTGTVTWPSAYCQLVAAAKGTVGVFCHPIQVPVEVKQPRLNCTVCPAADDDSLK